MPDFTGSIPRILDAIGDPGPSPGPSAVGFEAVASVFLGRAGQARAALAAIDALRESGWLDPGALAEADPSEVEDAWRLAGARSLVKAVRPLQRLARWASGALDGPMTTEALRDGLRALNGVGPATADAILLEGLGLAAYPIDRATYRILVRHGWLDPTAGYDEARALVEAALPDDPIGLARLSAGFERLGRLACRASVAKCDRCPLRALLPEGAPGATASDTVPGEGIRRVRHADHLRPSTEAEEDGPHGGPYGE